MIIYESYYPDYLNPKFFDNNQLKSNIRNAILNIVDEFKNEVTDDKFDFNILDILLVGSNASYNYTDQSDLDIHLVVDLSDICHDCPDILQRLFDDERRIFNNNYDISLKGVDVEIYVEDIHSATISNGIYSVLFDKWIKFPSTLTDVPSMDTVDIISAYNDYESKINQAISTNNPDIIKSMIDSIYVMRKYSLSDNGEFSTGNYLFKKIRNSGLLDKLKDAYYNAKSNELSVEELIIDGLHKI